MFLLFLQRECASVQTVEVPVETVVYDTIRDSIIITPEPVLIEIPGDTIYTRDTVYVNDGTLPDAVWNIVSDYYSTKHFKDTLLNDTSLFIAVNTSVLENRIENMSLFYENRTKQVICPEPLMPKNKLFIGGQLLGSPTQFGAGPSLALLTKRDGLYVYNYDLINNTHGISIFYKLSLK